MAELTKRQKYIKRLSDLKSEQSSWRPHWLDISEQIQPMRSRLISTERNRGDKKNTHIINGTPIWASEVEAAGMLAGLSSPARPWFRLGTPDPELAEVGSVRMWLNIVAERIRYALARGGVYKALHELFLDLVTFGTGALYIEEHPTRLLRAVTFPIGSYYLANGADGRVDSVYREMSMTVAQMVEEFTLEKCSQRVKDAHKANRLDEWVEICLVIEPNREMKPGRAGPVGMRWASCWFETAETNNPTDGALRESGYEEFPVMCPRWQTTGEDVYGRSPAMNALGDCRALQLLEKKKAMAVEKIVDPPLGAPKSLEGDPVSLLPGGLTFFDALSQGQRVQPIMDINPAAITVVGAEIQETERRIKAFFGADLWLMLSASSNQGPQKTATEVNELHEEKMLQLGPVVERMALELYDPLIDRVFYILLRLGYIPPAPEELQGVEPKVEYISVMAQAQKLIGMTAVERILSIVGNVAAVKPEVLDKIDFDQAVDEMGGMLGTPPDLIRSDEEVAAIRQQRAQAQQQQQMAEQAAAMADGAKTLSETDTQGDNALTRIMNGLGGPASAAAGTGRPN